MKNLLLKVCLFSLYIILIITTLFNSYIFSENIILDEPQPTSPTLPQDTILKYPEDSISFSNTPITKISNIKIFLFNKQISSAIYEKSQRYYVDLENLCNLLNIDYIVNNDMILIGELFTLDIPSNSTLINNSQYFLRGNIILIDSNFYISLSDIEYLFKLRTDFDYETNSINLVKNDTINKMPLTKQQGKIALLRLEDISSGGCLDSPLNMQKLKIVSDLLYLNNIAFHVSWVPRYIDPINNIDNDLLNDSSIENIAFINLIDHFINSGALIGLHGYSHQYINEPSLSGTELSKYANSTTEETSAVIEKSLTTAISLNIPIAFFESPHYKSSKLQKSILEKYFKYLYEPYNFINWFKIKHTKSNNIYIPTPLDYVKDLNPSYIIKTLENPNSNILISFFYHPTQEFDFIDISFTDTLFYYTYSAASPLYQIINSLSSNDYITSYITILN